MLPIFHLQSVHVKILGFQSLNPFFCANSLSHPVTFRTWHSFLSLLQLQYVLYCCYVFPCCCLVAKVLSDSFATPWTVDCQTPLSMGFPRQEYRRGLPFLSPRDRPNPGIQPVSPVLQTDSSPLSHGGFPFIHVYIFSSVILTMHAQFHYLSK